MIEFKSINDAAKWIKKTEHGVCSVSVKVRGKIYRAICLGSALYFYR